MKKTTLFVLALILMLTQTATADSNNGLVAHWPLDEGSGSMAADVVGFADGTLINNPVWTDGIVGDALEFDGSGAHVAMSEAGTLFADPSKFTISLWVRPNQINDGSYHGIIGSQTHYSDRSPSLWLTSGQDLHYDSHSDDGGNRGVRFHGILPGFFDSENTWIHLCWIKDSTTGTYKFYKNGQLFAQRPAPENFYLCSDSYWIGKVDNHFNGTIDDVRIYNRKLSVDDVRELYQQYFITVDLPCIGDGWYGSVCENNETILIPKERPIYALLVSGFHQNKNLDMFHFYNFAKHLQEKGAYVHYAWWNNLLAPYMERPLHTATSVPSHGTWGFAASYPHHDIYPGDPRYCCGLWRHPNKAIPPEDNQFQADARALLNEIRQHNPDAIIVLAGHSMGGDAIVRLADSMDDDFVIDLLAPIDPVGNRTCVPGYCGGYQLFTRHYTVREDSWNDPPKRELGSNIKYLYHRWQNEFDPPWDHESTKYFNHPALLLTSIPETHDGSTNVQFSVPTSLDSGLDVPPPDGPNYGGGTDGHGEIVGFRGSWFNPIGFDTYSWPLGLEAQGDWPNWQPGQANGGPDAQRRMNLLKAWENDPNYLSHSYEPSHPDFCMVSGGMGDVLDILLGDFDLDGDIDGLDLAEIAAGHGPGTSTAVFAANYGQVPKVNE